MRREIECDVRYVRLWSNMAQDDIPGVHATCSVCGAETEAFGTDERSITRCMAEMRETCAHATRDDYYVPVVRGDPSDVQRERAQRKDGPPPGTETISVRMSPANSPTSSRQETPRAVASFRGDYHFLSNFFLSNVLYDGYVYPSAEHAFQAAKVGGSAEEIEVFRAEIRDASSPARAKYMGRQVTLRSDWEEVKVAVMSQVVMQKFAANPTLRRKLVNTGKAQLIEGNTWGDRFWGAEWERGKWQGENMLGKILEGVRERLR
jgi:ribA/ribD-fused uncharacterized protein